jgi:hypothetical protein
MPERVYDELLFILSFCAKTVLTRAKQYHRMYQSAMMSIDESSNLLKNPPPNSPNRIYRTASFLNENIIFDVRCGA